MAYFRQFKKSVWRPTTLVVLYRDVYTLLIMLILELSRYCQCFELWPWHVTIHDATLWLNLVTFWQPFIPGSHSLFTVTYSKFIPSTRFAQTYKSPTHQENLSLLPLPAGSVLSQHALVPSDFKVAVWDTSLHIHSFLSCPKRTKYISTRLLFYFHDDSSLRIHTLVFNSAFEIIIYNCYTFYSQTDTNCILYRNSIVLTISITISSSNNFAL
jgi:hypothetical protein